MSKRFALFNIVYRELAISKCASGVCFLPALVRAGGGAGSSATLLYQGGALRIGIHAGRPDRPAVAPGGGKAAGQPFVVDYRAGASGVIGADHVAKSAPDGDTLLVIPASFNTAPSTVVALLYDTLKDFTVVSPLARGHPVLIANPRIPAHNLKALIALAKAQPGKLIPSKYGILDPAATPRALVNRLNGALEKFSCTRISKSRTRLSESSHGGPRRNGLARGSARTWRAGPRWRRRSTFSRSS
jgi:hypothetical protein